MIGMMENWKWMDEELRFHDKDGELSESSFRTRDYDGPGELYQDVRMFHYMDEQHETLPSYTPLFICMLWRVSIDTESDYRAVLQYSEMTWDVGRSPVMPGGRTRLVSRSQIFSELKNRLDRSGLGFVFDELRLGDTADLSESFLSNLIPIGSHAIFDDERFSGRDEYVIVLCDGPPPNQEPARHTRVVVGTGEQW